MDINPYRLSPDTGEAKISIANTLLLKDQCNDLAQYVPLFAVKDVYADGAGNMPLLSIEDLMSKGTPKATPDDDTFFWQIQFTNVKYLDNPNPGTDPVVAYGPLFSCAELYKALSSGNPNMLQEWLMGMRGQPGIVGGGDAKAAFQDVAQLMGAAPIKAAIVGVMTSKIGAPAPAEDHKNDPVIPTGPVKKNIES